MPVSAGLRSLYRQIEAGEVELPDAPEPTEDVPSALGLYFGAQVGWDTTREGGTIAVEWACDLATHETLVVELCPVCLSGFHDTQLGHRVVCMGCLRSNLDARIMAILRAEDIASAG
jgi:hypothetical protein